MWKTSLPYWKNYISNLEMYISKLDLYISSLEIYKSSVKIQISYCMGKLFHRSCSIFCTDAVNFWQGGRKSRKKKGAGGGRVYIL